MVIDRFILLLIMIILFLVVDASEILARLVLFLNPNRNKFYVYLSGFAKTYPQQKALFQVVFSRPKVANMKTRSANLVFFLLSSSLSPLRLNNWVTSVASERLAGPWESNRWRFCLILPKTVQF